jgi:hypothetical protein
MLGEREVLQVPWRHPAECIGETSHPVDVSHEHDADFLATLDHGLDCREEHIAVVVGMQFTVGLEPENAQWQPGHCLEHGGSFRWSRPTSTPRSSGGSATCQGEAKPRPEPP